MRHLGLADPSPVRPLTATMGQLASFRGLAASACCPHLPLSPSLPASCATIPLPVVAVSTDREHGAATGRTGQERLVWRDGGLIAHVAGAGFSYRRFTILIRKVVRAAARTRTADSEIGGGHSPETRNPLTCLVPHSPSSAAGLARTSSRTSAGQRPRRSAWRAFQSMLFT
jgi:hypothetical protein